MKNPSAALHLFCVYKRTEDGGQSDNSCSAAKTPEAWAKRQMQRKKNKSQ